MAIPITVARKLCTEDELRLVESSRGPGVAAMPAARLKQNIVRARTLRDRYRDLARRQRLEARGKTRASGSRPAQDNRNTVLKSEIFAETLDRLQKQSGAATGNGGAGTAKKAAAKKTGAKKASARKTARKTPAKASSGRKAAVRKTTGTTSTARKATTKKAAAKEATAKQAAGYDGDPASATALKAVSRSSRAVRKERGLAKAGVQRAHAYAGGRTRRTQGRRDSR